MNHVQYTAEAQTNALQSKLSVKEKELEEANRLNAVLSERLEH